MEAILNAIISELNSSVFVLIAILFVCFFLVYKVGHWAEMFNNHKSRIDNVEGIKDTVIALSTKIDLIYQNTNPNPLVHYKTNKELARAIRTLCQNNTLSSPFKQVSPCSWGRNLSIQKEVERGVHFNRINNNGK